MPASRITLPHFSVSSVMNLSKSAGEPAVGEAPNLSIRTFISGSAMLALISLLSLSMISTGVVLRKPATNHWLAF